MYIVLKSKMLRSKKLGGINMPESASKINKEKNGKKYLKRGVKLCFLLLFSLLVFYTIQGYGLYIEAVSQNPLEKKVREIRAAENFASLDNISQDFINGLIAVEDHRFYDHGALDLSALSRAVIKNILAWDFAEGGSTITQQLAKNIYFSFEKTLPRKVAEAFVASDLEMNYEKDELLELYINIIYFGDGYYGITAASRGYFDTEPKDLSLAQAALLAGLPKAPSFYALNNNPDKAILRREAVLEAMVRYNYLDPETAQKVKDEV